MIQLEHVTLEYKNQADSLVQALQDVSLQVAVGELVSIVGPSGCGKSSLLHLISGLKLPTCGKVTFDGAEITGPQPDIALILQDYGLFPWKTVYQNVALGLVLRKADKAQIAERVNALLRDFGLTDKAGKYPSQLSGGQRQRVAIARALVLRPRLLLMDEPFCALDVVTQEKMENIVLELCRTYHLTLVMVTHNIEEAVFLGQRIVVFGQQAGKISRVLDNSLSGSLNYRESGQFHEQCSLVRRLLGGGEVEKENL